MINIFETQAKNALISNFGQYYSTQQIKRFSLIKQNIFYKSTFPSSIPISVTKFQVNYCKENNCLISLPPSKAFTQNFYCYPIKENFLCESNFFVPYFEYFPSLQKFKETMMTTYDHIVDVFHFIPTSLSENERIENKFFFIWSFICILIALRKAEATIKFNEQNVYNIIEAINNVIDKNIKYMYKIISNYVMPIQHLIKIKSAKPITVLHYRKAFCLICLKYLCRRHFYNAKIEMTYHGFFVVKTELKNISGERKCFNQLLSKNTNNKEENVCCGYSENECKFNTKVALINQEGIEENHIEIFKVINKNSFYLLNCLLKAGFSPNSCFFFKLFGEKYPCYLLEKILIICSDDKNKFEIDNYLNYAKMGQTFPKISHESNDIILSKKSYPGHDNLIQCPRYNSNRKDYIPCDHLGECTRNNCNCIKSKYHCEKYCICAHSNCFNAFKGCDCYNGCSIKSLSNNTSKCLCVKEERECSADTCKKCFAKGNCKNMSFTNKQFKKTALSKTSLSIKGAGLFAYQDIAPFELIDEYLGEIVEKNELERRHIINQPFERNYGFELTKMFDVDALRCGNALRYINHANFGKENCIAREIFVQGLTKILLFSSKKIMRGNELFFNYNMKNCSWIDEYNKSHENEKNKK